MLMISESSFLQTLKQNTEPAGGEGTTNSQKQNESRKKESVSTQTQTPIVGRTGRFNHHENPNLAANMVFFAKTIIFFKFLFQN